VTAVDIVVPVWNSRHWIDDCLAALRLQTLIPRTIIVVDDGSSDGILEWLRDNAPEVQVERLAAHRGFAAAANRGIRAATAPLVALLNVDTQADPEWLSCLATALEDASPQVGMAASKMLRLEAPESIDNAGDHFTHYGSALKLGHGDPSSRWTEQRAILSASAGAALYRRSMLDEIGLFDESFESYLEDVELGLRAQLAGYGAIFVPTAQVLHQGGGSGLPRGRYVRLITANRVATVLHTFSAGQLWRHALRLLWGQWYFLVASRRPWQSLLGYIDLIGRLPRVLNRRREIQSRRRIDAAQFELQLGRELGEPPLSHLLRRWWTGP